MSTVAYMNMEFGFVKAKKKMIQEGLTTSDIADALGISRVNASYKLNGDVQWTLRDIYLFGEVCGIPDRDLLTYFPKRGITKRRKKKKNEAV